MPQNLTTHSARNEEFWDAFVHENGGGFLQSWGWSRFQEAVGRTVYRFRIDRSSDSGGEVGHKDTVIQFTLMAHGLPFGFKYAYVPRGPIMLKGGEKDEAKERLGTFIAAVRDAIKRKGYIFSRVEFPWTVDERPVASKDIQSRGFVRVNDVQPTHTTIVDLDAGENELLAQMHSKTRYNIRVAKRHGVVIREACRDNAHLFRHDIDVFWGLLAETSFRDSFHTHAKSYYEKMLDALSPKKGVGMSCRLHFAEYQGKAIAAAITTEYGNTVTYLHGASVAEFRKVMAPNLLHWELIRQAKADGFGHYDFWGIAPPDEPEHRWAGITRFKTGYGGRVESYIGAWELPGNYFLYTLYKYAKRFRNT